MAGFSFPEVRIAVARGIEAIPAIAAYPQNPPVLASSTRSRSRALSAIMKATSLALDHLLRAIGDPIADLRDIGPGHAEFSRALTLRAGAGVLSKSPRAWPLIAQATQQARDVVAPPAARAHFAAAEAWLAGNPVLAAESYASILDRWPHDLLAMRLAQSCFFFLGWHDRLCALVDAVLPAWPSDRRGYGFVLAIASFAHAENGDAAHAELLGRASLAIDPACPLGVHSVAHAIAESGRPHDGARWMRDQVAHWAAESRMRTHNAWHLAMFDAEEGNVASALGILDRWLLPASANSSLDACDATALLCRLSANGFDDASRWKRISNAFAQTMAPGFWPYVDLHAVLAHLKAGESLRMHALSRAIHRCAEGSDYAALRARHITLPGLRALNASSEGRHAEAAGLFADLRPLLSDVGGSRVQLDIFRSIEREAPHTRAANPVKSCRPAIATERTFRSANMTHAGNALAHALPT